MRPAELRLRGWQQCIGVIETTNLVPHEYPSGRRGVQIKGRQCTKLVSPEAIAKIGLGVPVCNLHLSQVQQRIAAAVERRRRLDPGPVKVD